MKNDDCRNGIMLKYVVSFLQLWGLQDLHQLEMQSCLFSFALEGGSSRVGYPDVC